MNVKTVQCCQCGSPLQLPENAADVRFFQCQHCMASLEVQDLECGIVTRLRSDLIVMQEATAKHARLLEALRMGQELQRLDRDWQSTWGSRANVSEGNACLGALMLSLMIGFLAVIILRAGWSARAPLTRVEAQREAESFVSTLSILRDSKTTMKPFVPIPLRPHIPTRIGSVLFVILLSGIIYLIRWDVKRFVAALDEYDSRRQSLQVRISMQCEVE